MPSTRLIRILADGQLHSGQDLARTLGVSRTAIWKYLVQLETKGLEIIRVRGKGYRLVRPLDLLDQNEILEAFPGTAHDQIEWHLHDSLASTNDYLSNYHQSRAPFAVCLAEQQTAGKGRRGRPWESPFARNLYLSLAFDSARGVSGLDGLSLVIAVAVVKSLASLGVLGLGIKWPNDIWVGERKLAGILIELSGELQTRCHVVIGLGLNVYMSADDEVAIDQPWTSLAQLGVVPEGGRNRLAATLVQELLATLALFEAQGFEPFRAQWEAYDVLQGRSLAVMGQETQGIGAGIDAHGAYCLETAKGRIYLNAGEVRIQARTT